MKNSHAFDAVCFQLHSDFVGASQQFADSPSASNFNHLNHAALAHQQAQWLKKTPQLTALRRDLTAKKIVATVPCLEWGQAVIDCACELTA
jgi:hypothetical protein